MAINLKLSNKRKERTDQGPVREEICPFFTLVGQFEAFLT